MIFIIALIAITIAVVIGCWIKELKRNEALQRVAEELGMNFIKKGDDLVRNFTSRFRLFDHGGSRRVRNLMHGDIHDLKAFVFDYSFTTSTGESSTSHHQSVAAFNIPDRNLPKFMLQPEGLFQKLGALVGFMDIDFADHHEFSKRFQLRGDDEEAIRALFPDDLLGFFEAYGKVSVEADGQWMVVYRSGKRRSAEEIPQFLEQAFEVCNRLG